MQQRQMTRSVPQRDTREMLIPEGTIKPEPRRHLRLPLVWLRTWIMGLLAIIALPIGAMLVLVSQAQEGSITDAWIATTATVESINDAGLSYSFMVDGTSRTGDAVWLTQYDKYFSAQVDGSVGVRINLCDILAPVVYPNERGEEFTLWVAPSGRFVSCFPVNENTPPILNFLGWALIIVGSWIIISNIGRSANYRASKRNKPITMSN